MKKNYKLTIVFFLCSIFGYSQNVTFNVDLNGSAYPTTAQHIIRIAANPNSEGWNGNFVELTDTDNDGIYSGTASNVSNGTLLFQVREGDPGSNNWGNEVVPVGCDVAEFDGSNYIATVSGNVTLNFAIGKCLTPLVTTDITFNVDLNGTSYPEAGNEIRIGGNAANTGWSPDILTLTDTNNDGIYTGTTSDIPAGEFLFRIFQGNTGVPGWASGDWISDITSKGCDTAESLDANYKTMIQDGVNKTINVTLNECMSPATLGNVQFSIDFNGTSYPTSQNHIIRIAANPNATGWNGNFIELSDVDADNIYTGTVYGVAPGEILFQVLEGASGSTSWGDAISDPTGCATSEFEGGNYKANITIAQTTILNFKLGACNPLSSKDFELADTSIFPNPVKDFINISSTKQIKSISIYNMLGGKVLENKKYNQSQKLDISSFASGMYLLQLEDENGNSKVVKFIKH